MPIYAYRCDTCGHAKDVLQKLSDPVLSTCPSCGTASFRKQVTAAGFQLKGSGWYVTDFRGGANGAAKPDAQGDGKADGAKPDGLKPDGVKPDTAAAATTPAAAASGSAGGGESAASGGGGSSCAGH